MSGSPDDLIFFYLLHMSPSFSPLVTIIRFWQWNFYFSLNKYSKRFCIHFSRPVLRNVFLLRRVVWQNCYRFLSILSSFIIIHMPHYLTMHESKTRTSAQETRHECPRKTSIQPKQKFHTTAHVHTTRTSSLKKKTPRTPIRIKRNSRQITRRIIPIFQT